MLPVTYTGAGKSSASLVGPGDGKGEGLLLGPRRFRWELTQKRQASSPWGNVIVGIVRGKIP